MARISPNRKLGRADDATASLVAMICAGYEELEKVLGRKLGGE